MLSKDLKNCLAAAVKNARMRRHELVSIEHLLQSMLSDPKTVGILSECGANIDILKHQIENYLSDKFKSLPPNKLKEPVETPALQRVIQRAILHVHYSGENEVHGGHVLVAMYKEQDSYGLFFIRNQNITRLDIINAISATDNNNGSYTIKPNGGDLAEDKNTGNYQKSINLNNSQNVFDGAGSKNSTLYQYTSNFTEFAKKEKFDDLIGRSKEIARTVTVLLRRRKNNPLLVGEPGVGKTAIVEGLAIMSANNTLPAVLKGVEIFSLDLGALLAGTKYRGDFEMRFKSVIKGLKNHPKSILFIDEIHTLIGTGATSGSTLDASNILKPLLVDGDVKCIGATTFNEFRNVFKKDSALSRRFQKIEILEPTVKETFEILKGLKNKYENHYGVNYSNSALKSAAELSAKYIHNNFLPDKAIDVIDEAGAFFIYKDEKNTNDEQQNKRRTISINDIERTVSMISRIPAMKVSSSEIEALKSLENDLTKVIFGQDTAVKTLVASIKRNKAGLKHPERPIGCFLLTGPTGVGKTELCKQLSRLLNIGFDRFDMSEYMEKHAIARLIGTPPGYVGFDQGGLLTEIINKNPHTVILFDEIEKAHPEIFNVLLQVMDYGKLTDNTGQKSDFRNTIIIMTSNVGSEERVSKSVGFHKQNFAKNREKQAAERMFPPEFRNRLDAIIPFANLNQSIMIDVVNKFINELQLRLINQKVSIKINDDAKNWLAEKGYSPEYGARPLARVLQEEINDKISDEILFGKLIKGGSINIKTKKSKLSLEFRPRASNNKKIKKETAGV